MDDIEESTRYPGNAHSNSSDQQKVTLQNSVGFTRNASNNDVEIYDEDDGEDEQNSVQRIGQNEYVVDDNEEEEDGYGSIQKHPKKRKLKTLLLSSYVLAPRVPEASSSSKIGGRNSTGEWTEHETSILLSAWGNKYVQHRRKSLRSDEWQEVAEKVSEGSQIDRTDSQCRNRLDTLKKKYKKEKAKMTENGGSCFTSKWIYFDKMDSLMNKNSNECALLTDPEDYRNHVNGLDEMRDNSQGNLNSEEDSEGPSRIKKKNGKGPYRLFANCVEKFSEIYVKTENSKRQMMQELEKMRMEFLRDLESQKEEIFQKGQAKIAKIQRGDDENDDEEDDANIDG